MSNALEVYKDYMDNAHWNYTTREQFEQYYNRVPKFRYDTIKYCWDQVVKYDFKTIVELGTTRLSILWRRTDRFPLYGYRRYAPHRTNS